MEASGVSVCLILTKRIRMVLLSCVDDANSNNGTVLDGHGTSFNVHRNFEELEVTPALGFLLAWSLLDLFFNEESMFSSSASFN